MSLPPSSRDIESVAACGGNKQIKCRRLARRSRDGRSSFQRLQIFLLSRRNAVAFPCFLDRLVMRPRLKPIRAAKYDDRRVPLLGQRRGEKPRDHHLRVVILQLHVCGQLQIFRLEISRPENASSAFPARNGRCRRVLISTHSRIFLQQLRLVPGKRLRRQAVADGPVVDIRQKRLDRFHARVVVLHLRKQYAVQDVFVVVRMRQFRQKGAASPLLRRFPSPASASSACARR